MTDLDANPSMVGVTGLAKTIRLLLMTIVVGVPLFFLGPLTYDAYSLPKLALLLGGVGTVLGLVGARWLLGIPPRHVSCLAVPALALVAPLAVSWLASPHRAWTLLGSYARYTGLLPYVAVAALGVLLVDAFWRRADRLVWALSLSGAAVGTYAFLQALGVDPLWSPGIGRGSEYPPSTIGHFNFVGGFLALSLPLSIYIWTTTTNRGPRIAAIWATVASAVGLLLANSQGGWAAAIAGVAVIGGSFLGLRWKKARPAGMIAAGAVAVTIIAAVVTSAFIQDAAIVGGTIRERGRLWVTALEMGVDSPITGHGPSAYALEGVRYRSLASVLSEKDTKADDPHSVPLSFWANAGALGAVGFGVFVAWIVATGRRIVRTDHRSTAFFAAIVGYLVQSLVTIDLLPLRSGLWTALAGLVISMNDPEPSLPAPRADSASRRANPGMLRIAISSLVAVLTIGTSLWYSGNLIFADRRVQIGQQRFADGDVAAARKEFERAIAFRFEPRYRNLYGEGLGIAALNRGERGEPLIREMRRVYSYLDDFPETYGIVPQARTLHYWGQFEPAAELEALHLLQRARSLDPENPGIDVGMSEVLIELGEVERALQLLAQWEHRLEGSFPSFWGALSTAHLVAGDASSAAAALDEGMKLSPSDCRVRIAEALMNAYIDPARRLDSDDSLTLRIACGEGDYLYLSNLVAQLERR